MRLGLSCFAVGLVCFFAFLNPLAAEVIDEFEGSDLDTSLWEIKAVGGATYTIDSGVLTMTSPAVESGIILYYPVNIENKNITFEVKMDTSVGMDFSYIFGTIAQLLEPQVNTVLNNNWMAMFLLVPDGKVNMKVDPENIGGQIAPTVSDTMSVPGLNVFAIKFDDSAGEVTYFLNGEEIGVVEKNPNATERYLLISPDIYTSHYTGTINIDYIKISGPDAPLAAAVGPSGKLAATWAGIKR